MSCMHVAGVKCAECIDWSVPTYTPPPKPDRPVYSMEGMLDHFKKQIEDLKVTNKDLQAEVNRLCAAKVLKAEEQETRWDWLTDVFVELSQEYHEYAATIIPVIYKCRYEPL
jgi:hypothetical protein